MFLPTDQPITFQWDDPPTQNTLAFTYLTGLRPNTVSLTSKTLVAEDAIGITKLNQDCNAAMTADVSKVQARDIREATTKLRSGNSHSGRCRFNRLGDHKHAEITHLQTQAPMRSEAAVALSCVRPRGRENTFRNRKNGIVKIILSPVGGDRENT